MSIAYIKAKGKKKNKNSRKIFIDPRKRLLVAFWIGVVYNVYVNDF